MNVFRNATSAVRREYRTDDGRTATLTIEEITHDADRVVRHVLCDVVDTRRETAHREHLATLTFFPGGRSSQRKRGTGDHWKFAILHATTGQDRIQTEDQIAEVDRRCTELAANLTSAAVRGVVRALLVEAGAVLLKSTAGLYFVHVTHAKDLAKVKTLIERMGLDCDLQRHGLLDTADAREMVTAALEREIDAACASLTEEITKLMVGRTVPAKNYADVAATYQAIARRSEYGSDLLGVPLERASTALERSLEQLLGLRAKLSAKKGKPV